MIKFWFDKYRPGRPSHRLRAALPSRELAARGHDSAIVTSIDQLSPGDVVLLTKDSSLDSLKRLKSLGYVVGFDLCDNKFQDEQHGDILRIMCQTADFVTANTRAMQQVILDASGCSSYFFTDPVDHGFSDPRVREHPMPVQLVWYGGMSSIKHVNWRVVIGALERSNIMYHLTVVVDKMEKIREGFFQGLEHFDNLRERVTHVSWTWEAQHQAVDRADIVLIPMLGERDITRERIITKSHNRLVDGIAQGRWVVSTAIPSYLPLQEFCHLGDPIEGIRRYLTQPLEVGERISRGQDWIRENATVQVTADQLEHIYEQTRKKK